MKKVLFAFAICAAISFTQASTGTKETVAVKNQVETFVAATNFP